VVGTLALTAGMALAVPMTANAAVSTDTAVIINEVYGGAGSASPAYHQDFIELYNAGTAEVDLSSFSLQYAAAAGTNWSGQINLTGRIAPGKTYLVPSATGQPGPDLPAADEQPGTMDLAGANGNVALVSSQTRLTCSTTACAAVPQVVDLVGYGTGKAYAGTAAAPAGSATKSVSRDASHTNTADNAADFTAGTPSPTACGADCAVTPPEGGDKTIAEIQGTSDVSPLNGATVTTKGVVTAAYPTGGYFGFAIQTPGTGGDLDFASHDGSDGLWVYMTKSAGDVTVEVGDYVQVTGTVEEFKPSGSPYGLTELSVAAAGDVVTLDETVEAIKPITNAWPATDAQRESIESMVFAGSGTYTISNTYATNQYGEVGLALGDTPLMQWTDVAAPGSAEADAVIADNAARGVILDDGASTNFLSSGNMDLTPPYISLDDPVRVGETVTFTDPVIVDYRNNAWKLQPTGQVTPTAGNAPVTWTNNRTATPDADALGDGDLRIASFNVLNYFTTLGDSRPDCTPYTDRAGNGIATKSCTGANGPRGAWDAASLQRQQDKIVHAINALDADVIGLMEIENSLVVDGAGHADEALSTLVDALNADAGATKWAFVPSSGDLPPASEMDVITNAIIYQVASVERAGDSHALGDQSGSGEPFVNAREPIAQAFTPIGDGDPFTVVVNHFKSKGSAGPLPGDEDSGDGQGASNASRMAQATALADWVNDVLIPETGVDDVFLAGDFNSYTMEDPLQILYTDGWTDINSHYETGKQSYNFGGMNGSLDHVLANASALDRTTGADIWNINAPESIALEYSRYNYHGTLFYDDSPYRSSDHDPVVVGVDSGASQAPTDTQIQILGINDFHGRIQANGQEAGAAVLAGAVDDLRDGNPNTVFAAAGDLIGASTFESFIAHDKPTIDALNAAGLEVSAVGNHEFDQGYDDLVNRVMAPYDEDTNPYGGAEWKYLGANVKMRDSGDPALDPTWVKEMNGVKVGFVGAVTEHLPELVSPAGIADIEVTDIADAVNTEADELKAQGVDIVVMLVHEGAPQASCDSVIDPSNDFGAIVTRLDENVDAVISGHTHLTYNCMVDVAQWQDEDRAVTQRPVVSAGQYGYNLDQLLFTVSAEGDVTGVESNTIALTKQVTDPDDATKKIWVPNYTADGTVGEIVSKAVADAEVLGAVPLGAIAGPFNRAKDSSNAENRGGESTLGNLVAEAQRWATRSETTGSAQIAFMNPGGLRADMLGKSDGGYPAVLTYQQAATVQPFANTLVNMTLTGAQIKSVLEQQWQPAGASRPFLRLGISQGFTYTYDPAADEGEHIVQMWLDGEPIAADATYSVTVNSFLAAGGDNFFELANGANPKDTGQTDLQGMVDYMAAMASEAALPVDNSQRSVGVHFPSDAPSEYQRGAQVAFDLSSLSMSTGTATDDEVTVSLGDTVLGTFPVDSGVDADKDDETGTAAVTVTLPADIPDGLATLTITGNTTGTTSEVSVTVSTPVDEPGSFDLDAQNATQTYGKGNGTKITAWLELDRGSAKKVPVEFFDNGVSVGTVVTNGAGKADYRLPKDAPVGTHSITVTYQVPGGGTITSGPVVVVVQR
jgi:5'-nucleotidase